MLLCVVGNCLLFYCSCTGNCENCCGINGNASVSSSIKNNSEITNVAVTRAKKNLHLVLIDVDTAKSPEQAKRFEEQNWRKKNKK